jgi:natural product biosynthesis luciferase-like monooxygenase protein
MLVVPMAEPACAALAAERGLSLAAVNGPESCVLSGPFDAIEQLERELTGGGVACRRVATSHAFHSRMLDPVLDEFAAYCAGVKFQPPSRPYLSNLTGTWITADQATDPSYWVHHLRHTVRFAEGVGALVADPDWVLLEVGPGRTLSTFARWNPNRATGQVVLNAMRHPSDAINDEAFLLTALGRFWMTGGRIAAAGFYRHEQRRRIPLPSYPFERQRCWIDPLPADGAPGDRLDRRDDMDQWFYAPSWKRTPAPAAGDAGACWLLLRDDLGLADAVAGELERRGVQPVVVCTTPSAGGDARAIRALEPADYDRLLGELDAAGTWPARILDLRSIVDVGAAADPEASFLAPLYLAQALGRRSGLPATDLVLVSNHLQEVTGDDVMCPERATLLGPCRVIPQELPAIACRHVDVDLAAGRPPDARLVRALIDEVSGGSERSVAYRNGHRWIRSFEPLPLPGPEAFRPRPGGVTLITGGLGGIGQALAEALIAAGAHRLVLIARHGLPPRDDRAGWLATHAEDDVTSRRIRAVERLERLGGEVLVIAADVADRGAMAEAVASARARFGEVHGVIHAAGVAGGGLIALRTAEAARRVLAPKVAGTLVLDDVFRDIALDFFVLCSSRSSILGGAGQVDYCAANAFLDAFAASTRARGRNRAVSIDWDAWRDAGMLVDQAAAHGVREARPTRSLEHVLFDGHVRESDDTDVYTTTLSPLRHWVLDEHRIVGNAVMPGTGYLEMARAAVQAHAGDRVVEIRDAFFLAPLGLRDDEEREVKMTVKRVADDEFSFRVTSKPPDESGWKDYATGRIALVPRAPARRHDLQAIIDRCSQRRVIMTDDMPRDEDLGPRWQALKVAHVGDNEHLARLELPVEFAGELETLQLHPSLLDRATGTGKEFLIKQGIYLPMGYHRLTIHRPLERVIHVHVRFRPEVDPTGQTITFDVVFMDEAGNELVDIEAFAQKRINDIAGQIRVFANRRYGRGEAARSAAPTASDALAGVYAEQLQQGITSAEGALAFRRIVAAGAHPQVVVSARDLHASRAQADRPRSIELAGDTTASAGPRAPRAPAIAPGDVEQAITDVWRCVLGAGEIGSHDNFFDLGGDSIQAIQIVAQINELGYSVTAQQLFQHQTVADLARLLGEAGPPAAALSAGAAPAPAEATSRPGTPERQTGRSTEPATRPLSTIPRTPVPPTPPATPTDAPAPTLAAAPALARDPAPQRPEPGRRLPGHAMDFGLFFFADSSDARDKYRLYLESARFADRHGFSAVWTPERHFHPKGGLYPNPSVLSAALAVSTERIQLRAGSVVMPLHNPLRVAEEWSVVDNLSRGRVGISFVSGWVPKDFAFFPERYARKRDEMFQGVEQVRRLWRGEAIQTTDGAGKPADIQIFPRPVQPELPIWLTCSGAGEMFVTAGKLGFDVLTSLQQQTIDALAGNLEAYRRARETAGLDPAAGKVAVMMHTFLGPDKDTVLGKVREPLSNYLRSHLDLVKSFTSSLDIEAGLEHPERIDTIVQFAFERYHRTASLIGTPRDCRAMVGRLARIGVTEIACLIDFGVDVESTLDSLTYLDELRRMEYAESIATRAGSVKAAAT